MKGFFPPEEDMEEYAEKLCKLLLDKHEETLLYTEMGLRQKLNVTEAEEIIENMKSAWEEDAPNMYTIISKRDDERVVLMDYEDYIEAVIAKKRRYQKDEHFYRDRKISLPRYTGKSNIRMIK